jgi:dipeptidyl aminopeptidase/acylaminoacyl peptidase
MLGDPWQFRSAYIENSPYFFLDRVTAPILIIHGVQDLGTGQHVAEEMFVGLRRLGKRATYAVYDGEGHYPERWRYRNARDFVNRVLGWFEKHLPDPSRQSAPASAKR